MGINCVYIFLVKMALEYHAALSVIMGKHFTFAWGICQAFILVLPLSKHMRYFYSTIHVVILCNALIYIEAKL